MKNRTGILNFLQPFTLLMRSTIRKDFQTIQNQENYFGYAEYERLAEKYLDCIYRVTVNECHNLWRSGWKRHTTYLEDGTVQYSTTLDVQEEDSVSVVVTEDAEVSNPTCKMGTEDAETSSEVIEVAEENGRIYLLAGDMKLDITEDMTDGAASGSTNCC